MTDDQMTIDPELVAAIEALADRYTEGLPIPTADTLPVTSRIPLDGPAAGRSRTASRLAWWGGVGAAVAAAGAVVLLASLDGVQPGVELRPAGSPDLTGSLPTSGSRLDFPGATVLPFVVVLVVTVGLLWGGFRDRRRILGAMLWGGTIAATMAFTWRMAVAGNPSLLFLGEPGFRDDWILGAVFTLALIGAAAVGGWLGGRGTWKGWVWAVVGVGLVVLAAGTGRDVAMQLRFAGEQTAVLSAVAAAQAQVVDGSPCWYVSAKDVPGVLGQVDQVCVLNGDRPVVAFLRWADGPPGTRVRTGLVWDSQPGSAAVEAVLDPASSDMWASACLRRLVQFDQFAEYAQVAPDRICPANYTYVARPDGVRPPG